MAHEIDQTTGTAACFVTGKPAWHRLGKVIEKAATSAEAIKLAGLDWEVAQWPVRAFNPDKPSEEVSTDRVANVRMDTKASLGVVSRDYRLFQNRDAFDFMDSLVGDKLAMYETAGALKGGRRIWMLASIPKTYRAGKGDVVKPYVLLTTGHDGKSPVQMMPTTVRVVCNNTLTLALRMKGKAEGLTISHFANIDTRINEARAALGVIAARFDEFDEEMHRMLATKLTAKQSNAYFGKLFTGGNSDLAKKLIESKLEKVRTNYENERNTIGGMKGTAWAAYNAVSEYADHQGMYLGKTAAEKLDSQVNSVWFGGAHQLKQRAFDSALALSK